MKKNMESWILWKIYIKTTFWLILDVERRRNAHSVESIQFAACSQEIYRRLQPVTFVKNKKAAARRLSTWSSCGQTSCYVLCDRWSVTVDTRDILSYRSRTARLQRSDTYISRTLSSCVSPLHTIDVGSESLILPSISSTRNAVRMSPRLWSRSRTLFRSSPKQHRPIPCRTFFHWVLTFLHIPLQRLELGAHNSPVLHLVIEFVSTDQIQLIRDSVLLCISIKICMIHIHLTLTGHADRIPLRRRDCYRSFESRIR